MENKDEIKVFSNKEYFSYVESLLQNGENVKIPIRGKSMLPFLRETDKVVLFPPYAERFSLGDILLAREESGRVILHRLVKINKEKLILAGDGNIIHHETINFNQVIGVARWAIRGDKMIDLQSFKSKMLGMFWYKIRFVRRVYIKIGSLF